MSASSISRNLARRSAAPAEVNRNSTLPKVSIARLTIALSSCSTRRARRDVGRDRERLAGSVDLRRDAAGAVVVDVGADDVRALAAEDQCGGAADSARRAGDHDGLAVEVVGRLGHRSSGSLLYVSSLRGGRSPTKQSPPQAHGQVKRDCFAEFTLGLAEGETRGLAMTLG